MNSYQPRKDGGWALARSHLPGDDVGFVTMIAVCDRMAKAIAEEKSTILEISSGQFLDLPIHVNLRVGAVMSLVDTATGRVFAAFLPPMVTETRANKEIQRLAPESESKQSLIKKEFENSLNEVRSHMVSRALGYPVPGINALSAPVFNHDGNIILALTAMGPAAAFDASWDGDLANQLRRAAQNVSERLGFGVTSKLQQ